MGSEEIKRVVVLPIHSEGEGLRYAPTITDLVVRNLMSVGKYDILPAKDLKGLVEGKGMDWGKTHHYPQVLEIGNSLGVDGVIMGSLSQYGRMEGSAQFGLNLRMTRIPDGDIVWSMSCSARGKPGGMGSIAKSGIESIMRTLVHRWKSDGTTIAWGIRLQPLEASGGRRHITLSVPEYRETEIKEYIVTRSTAESGPYKKIKRLKMRRGTSLSFKDGGVKAGWTYFYRYRALTKNGFLSQFSESVKASLSTTPVTPRPLGHRGKISETRLSLEISPDRDVTLGIEKPISTGDPL
jgi:hypothetical protein